MAYVTLGSRPVTAGTSDPLGINGNNWTCVFDPSAININQSEFELYHLVLTGGPPGSTVTWYVNNNFYDTTPNGYLNSWDPNQPLLLDAGDSFYLYWNSNIGTPPVATAYFRYSTL